MSYPENPGCSYLLDLIYLVYIADWFSEVLYDVDHEYWIAIIIS